MPQNDESTQGNRIMGTSRRAHGCTSGKEDVLKELHLSGHWTRELIAFSAPFWIILVVYSKVPGGGVSNFLLYIC